MKTIHVDLCQPSFLVTTRQFWSLNSADICQVKMIIFIILKVKCCIFKINFTLVSKMVFNFHNCLINVEMNHVWYVRVNWATAHTFLYRKRLKSVNSVAQINLGIIHWVDVEPPFNEAWRFATFELWAAPFTPQHLVFRWLWVHKLLYNLRDLERSFVSPFRQSSIDHVSKAFEVMSANMLECQVVRSQLASGVLPSLLEVVGCCSNMLKVGVELTFKLLNNVKNGEVWSILFQDITLRIGEVPWVNLVIFYCDGICDAKFEGDRWIP